MTNQTVFTLVNPQNGNLAFKLFDFEGNSYFDHVQRNNYYTLIWLTGGKGKVTVDFSIYDFDENTLFAFSPYQPFMLSGNIDTKGVALQFHPDFFCIHKHQTEVACNGVLFNNGHGTNESGNAEFGTSSIRIAYLLFENISHHGISIKNRTRAQGVGSCS